MNPPLKQATALSERQIIERIAQKVPVRERLLNSEMYSYMARFAGARFHTHAAVLLLVTLFKMRQFDEIPFSFGDHMNIIFGDEGEAKELTEDVLAFMVRIKMIQQQEDKAIVVV